MTSAGDLMGPALSNLDSLVRMPTGCGEQNMVGFTPNIYVLQYLTATKRLTEEMEDKVKHYMEIGRCLLLCCWCFVAYMKNDELFIDDNDDGSDND